MRHALLILSAVLTSVLAWLVVDRQVMGPRRDADALVAAARPHASSSHEGAWLTAESLLARAELLHKDRADVRELRAQIAAGRAAQRTKDEVITAGALDACLGSIERAGLAADATRIRALTALSKRDQHVECMKVQLQHLNTMVPNTLVPNTALTPAPAVSLSSSVPVPATASASASTKP